MLVRIKKVVEVEAKYIKVEVCPIYWEDSHVNGVPDTEDGRNIPLRNGQIWSPTIDIDNGSILNWPSGTTADIHYKVCDEGSYTLLDENNEEITSKIHGYVPSCLCPRDNGYGDYIIMSIDGDGKIDGWKPDLDYFVEDETW